MGAPICRTSWAPNRADGDVPSFSTVIFHSGGTGARPGKDGLDVTAFPSGVRTIPVEATESRRR